MLTLEKNSTAEDYVNFLTDHLVPKSMNRQEIEDACQKDAEIQALIAAIRTNCWLGKPAGKTAKHRNDRNIDLTPYKSIRNELTVSDNGIVLLEIHACSNPSPQEHATIFSELHEVLV